MMPILFWAIGLFLRNRGNRRTGNDRHDELFLDEGSFQFFEDATQTLRLHRQHDDGTAIRFNRRRVQCSLAVLFKHLDAVLDVQLFTPRLARMAAGDLIRTNQFLAKQSGNDRFGHHAAPDKRQTRVVERIHLFHKNEDSAPFDS